MDHPAGTVETTAVPKHATVTPFLNYDVRTDETVLVRQIRFFTAICTFAAGLVHLLAVIDHREHPTLARAFLAVAAIQIALGILLLLDPRRLFVIVGGIVTAAAIVVWVFSRTKGISWFPGLEDVEALDWRGVVTQFFQLLALAGYAVLVLPASVHKPAGNRVELVPVALMSVLAMLALSVLYGATHGVGHH
jgi:hypothetical protein